jgi:hypothetical protein
MIGGGIGDMGLPMNPWEAAYVIFFMMCVYISFGFMLSNLWAALADFRADSIKYE